MFARSLLFLFVMPWAVYAQSPNLQIPAEVRADPSAFARVQATTDCPVVRWVSLDSGLNLFPPELLKDSRTAVVIATRPGRYRLLAVAAKDSIPTEPAICTVVVGDAPSPGPGPSPNPTPPSPVPAPDAEFRKALQSAYDLERGDTKDGHRLHLISVYQRGKQTARDPQVTQVFGLFTRMAAHRLEAVPDAEFTQVRHAINQELDKQLPRDNGASLDESTRTKCVEQFNRVIAALEVLK